jgi:hypothetical protein
MPPTNPEIAELKKLLEETHALAEESNRIIREMRRNALLGLGVKVLLWLVVLGAIPFILGPLLAPLMGAFTGQEGAQSVPGSLLGVPSEVQLNQLLDQYREVYQNP